MNNSRSPGSYPEIRIVPTLQDYQHFFPNSIWIICQNNNCQKVIRQQRTNYYHVVDKYLCGEHGWLYSDHDNY